jgi:hypothetical protein
MCFCVPSGTQTPASRSHLQTNAQLGVPLHRRAMQGFLCCLPRTTSLTRKPCQPRSSSVEQARAWSGKFCRLFSVCLPFSLLELIFPLNRDGNGLSVWMRCLTDKPASGAIRPASQLVIPVSAKAGIIVENVSCCLPFSLFELIFPLNRDGNGLSVWMRCLTDNLPHRDNRSSVFASLCG